MSLALDIASIYKVLVNDDALKSLMDIPITEKNNFGVLLDKYFLQTFISDKFTNDGCCRILMRNAMQSDTENDFVKWTPIIIEVYVPKNKDVQSGFQSKCFQITDRIQQLLHKKYVNSNKLYFISCYELISNSTNYRRIAQRFEFKKIYK